MANSSSPTKVEVRSYQVGFGDCFLLTFFYPNERRFVLIDFGTTGTPDSKDKDCLVRVANDIQKHCVPASGKKAKLHVVVATHRHRDHIRGFSAEARDGAPGKIIAGLRPDFVIQPWTEDPDAKKNATKATRERVNHFVGTLDSMHAFAGFALAEAQKLRPYRLSGLDQLSFIGEDNLKNASAVRNLMNMGKTNYYVNSGMMLNNILPGVRIHVLGPPTLGQSQKIKNQRSKDANEFWFRQKQFWGIQRDINLAGGQATGRPKPPGSFPQVTRWFIEGAAALRSEQLLQLVRILDDTMNNTSVILVFEFGGKKLLFPGDAQIENWEYALSQEKFEPLLKEVDLYKVGHHGSRNATPKSLWKLFDKRSPKPTPNRLKTVVSTMVGKHGDEQRHTEVPRQALMQEMSTKSEFFTTQNLHGRNFYHDIVVT